jgi:hypothetical protein
MCFNAPASFTLSSALAALGSYLMIKAKNKKLLLFASIPLFFALQQASEGVIWLYMPNVSSHWILPAKTIFLFFAGFFWPIWIPLSLWANERNRQNKQILAIFLGMGIVLGTFLLFTIPFRTVLPSCNSIDYVLIFSDTSLPILSTLSHLTFLFYSSIVIFPFFITSIKKMWLFGLIIAISGLILYAIPCLFFASMWCFVAAISSLCLFFVFKMNHYINF